MPRHSRQENRSALEAMGFSERLPLTRREKTVIWLADHKHIWRVIAWYRGIQQLREARKSFDKVENAEGEVKRLRPKTLYADIIWRNAFKAPESETDRLRSKVKLMPSEKVEE